MKLPPCHSILLQLLLNFQLLFNVWWVSLFLFERELSFWNPGSSCRCLVYVSKCKRTVCAVHWVESASERSDLLRWGQTAASLWSLLTVFNDWILLGHYPENVLVTGLWFLLLWSPLNVALWDSKGKWMLTFLWLVEKHSGHSETGLDKARVLKAFCQTWYAAACWQRKYRW